MKNYNEILDKLYIMVNKLISILIMLFGGLIGLTVINGKYVSNPIAETIILVLSLLLMSAGYLIFLITNQND